MSLVCRPILAHDSELLYRWRLQDEQNPWWWQSPVTRESHDQWFESVMNNPGKLLLFSQDGVPVGVLFWRGPE